MSAENIVFNKKGRLDLTNEKLAEKMSGVLGEKISKEGVGHYFTDSAGVPLKKWDALLKALKLKLVDEEVICLTPEEFAAYQLFARRGVG